jgi:chaperone required for assembly of F1-ATPase
MSAPDNGKSGPSVRGRPPQGPKRFYTSVGVATGNGTHRILLDGKPVRTPRKAELALPTRALAQAVAAEWEAQGTRIDPASMPLTRLVNSGLDGVTGREAAVRADICAYAGSDLVCYRAAEPEPLVQRQREAWDPVLDWAHAALGARFAVVDGIMPSPQPRACVEAVTAALARQDALALTALHAMTTLMGSVLLALAHAHGRLTAEQAWAAAHVDEDWQIEKWGWDAEAKARRDRRWAEMAAASRLLALLA